MLEGRLQTHCQKNPGLIYPRLGCLSFNAAICTPISLAGSGAATLDICAKCSRLQVGFAICLRYSRDDIICYPKYSLCCWNLSYNINVSAVVQFVL